MKKTIMAILTPAASSYKLREGGHNTTTLRTSNTCRTGEL